MTEQSPEEDHPGAFKALSNKVDTLLKDVEPKIAVWQEKDLSKIKGSPNGVIRAIQKFIAPNHQYRSVRKEVDLRLREGWEGVRIVDSALFRDGEQVTSGITATGYRIYDQGSFLMARAFWETPVAPDSVSDEEAITILGCIEGELSNREVADTTLQRLRVDHNL